MRSFIFFVSFLSLIACAKDPNNQALDPPSNPNLKYFGFSLVDVFFNDPSDDDPKTNYSDEVAPFSNIADIFVVSPEQNIISNLEIMDSYQMKAYLHLHELFFEKKSVGGGMSGIIYGLRADYKERWDEFTETNLLSTNSKYIASFYIGEEPFWNGIPAEEFTEACDFLDARFPDIPLLMVEAYAAIDEMKIPESVDWVGFDHYFIKDPSTDEDYQRELKVLLDAKTNEQKIFLILDAHHLPVFHNLGGITKNNLDEVARNYYEVANSNKEIIGIIGYFWPSGFDFPTSLGARGLPEHVRNEYARMGKAITGK